MKTLVWGESFRPAFKRRTRHDPRLQERIFQVLAILAEAFIRDGQPLYYEVDWHVNVAGNQLAGELIYEALAQPDGSLARR